MNLIIEHDNQHFYGFLDGIEVTYRLSNAQAERMNDAGYCFCHAGSESPVFFAKKALIKAARKQARQMGGELCL